jgi:diguanylate cyclase (GGDEF)-like protein
MDLQLKDLRPESIPTMGLLFACMFWFLDSAIDTFYLGANHLYIENLLRPETVELWGRIQVVSLMMLCSMIIMFLLQKHNRIRLRLQKYRLELESIVELRTRELCIKNTMLEDEIRQRQKAEEELVELANIDALTSIPNRRKFDEALQYEMGRDKRYHNKLSLIFCDLDHFKRVNDTHGHKIGDEILKEFTQLISANIRNTDIFARWGGEEFALLLPDTNIETATLTAEKLLIEIERHAFPYVGSMTASFGVTELFEDDNETSFIKRADDALYIAKDKGRNRIEALPQSKKIMKIVAGLSLSDTTTA